MRASDNEARPIPSGHRHYPSVTHPSPSATCTTLTLPRMSIPPPPPPPPVGAYEPPPGPASPAGEPLAHPGMRMLARFLDGLILGVIGYVIALILTGGDNSAGFEGIGGDAD